MWIKIQKVVQGGKNFKALPGVECRCFKFMTFTPESMAEWAREKIKINYW